MQQLAHKFPKVFKQQPVEKGKRGRQQQDTPWDFYNRVTATIQKYVGGLSADDADAQPYGVVLQQLEISLDYLMSRHNLRIDKVFLMGLPSGARYWSQMAEEALRLPLIAPSVFDGLALSPKNKELAELTPSKSQAFLAALGAARAAMEGQA